MVPTWLRQRLNRNAGRRRCRTRTAAWPARGLQLEALEDRWLLSAGPASMLSLAPHPAQASWLPLVGIDLTLRSSEVSVSIHLPSFVFPLSGLSASFQAVIDWGDGARSLSTLPVVNAAVVIGSHTYEPPPAAPAAAAPPTLETPAQPNSSGSRADSASVPSQVVVAAVLDTSRASGSGINAGPVMVRVALESVGESSSPNGRDRISIRLYFVTAATSLQEVSATLDDGDIVLALAPVLDKPDHLPPVPPVPPGVTGPPWKPSPPELLPAPHVPGLERVKGPIARSIPPGQSRSSSPNLLADNDLIAPVEGANSASVRGAALTTALPTDSDTDPVLDWFQHRARDLAAFLDGDRGKAGSPNAPADLFQGAAPEPAGQPALPLSLPQWLANDPILSLRASGNDPVAERLLPETATRADRGTLLFQPNAPAGNVAAAAPSHYFGQLDPVEEAEQEAAVAASTRGPNSPARRRIGWPYRLLLVLGYALWSFCWFRHGKFTGPRAPVLDGPRREKAMSGPIL